MSNWKIATLIKSKPIAQGVKSLTFKVEPFEKHKAGQHYNIRLTAEDGYQAERDYSIASSPEQINEVEFGVEVLEDGEVSPYLHQMKPGEQIEIRGPIGGHFVWDINMPGPLVLIGGGSGMVPLMSMSRHHLNNLNKDKTRKIEFLISAKTINHVLYKTELDQILKKDPNLKITYTLTRETPENWTGLNKRFDEEILTQVLGHLKNEMPMIYICGPTPFVENLANILVKIGFNPHEIRTERFGG